MTDKTKTKQEAPMTRALALSIKAGIKEISPKLTKIDEDNQAQAVVIRQIITVVDYLCNKYGGKSIDDMFKEACEFNSIKEKQNQQS